jgi:CubicO group peptidase (beta-lactamase class C family)
MKYEDYMKKNVLQPIGMTNSFFTQPPPPGTKNLATAYYGNGQPVKGKYHIYPEQAAAGLWTTPTDLAKFIIETQLEYQGKSSKVLSQEMMKKRMTFYIDSFLAYGVFLLNKNGEMWFSHNGGNEGFICTYYGSLKNGNGVAIMTNTDNFGFLSSVLNSVALSYGWNDFYKPVFRKKITPARDTLQAYTGTYLLVKDTLAVTLCGEELCITQNRQPPAGLKMLFTTITTASMQEIPGVTVTFVRNAEGKVDALEVNEGGGVIKCPRIN